MKNTLIAFIIIVVSLGAFAVPGQKVIVFYSSINRGHVQIAEEIKNSLSQDAMSDSSIILKDIRDFQPKIQNTASKKMYDLLITRFPRLFSRFYDNFLSKGQQVMALSLFKDRLDSQALENYIAKEAPGVVLSTHYGAAEALGNIRERGGLKNVRVGWLHTDFITSYFPRISKSIDKTFVQSDFVAQRWMDSGVSAEKVDVSGSPLSLPNLEEQSRELYKSVGLSETVTTITINLGASATEKEFFDIVDGIATRNRLNIQIFTKDKISSSKTDRFQKMFPHLVLGSANGNSELFDKVSRASDVMVVPSSYISETMGKFNLVPLIIYDNVPGVDHGNSEILNKSNLALASDKTYKIGIHVKTLLEKQNVRKEMLDAQLSYRNGHSMEKIVDFAKQPNMLIQADFKLGVEAGTTVNYTKQALEKLERDTPADFEILMAYGKYPNGDFFTDNGNPFGHLAIKVKDKVYTVNGNAKMGIEKNGVHVTSLEDYLYGVTRTNVNEEHTDTFGAAFARHTLSVRVSNVEKLQLEKLVANIEAKQTAWDRGEWTWKAREYNCADFVEEMLVTSGFKTPAHKEDQSRVNKFTFPLDVFDRYVDSFERDPKIRSEIVGYTYIPDSQNLFKRPTFPLSVYQPKRLIKHMVKATLRREEAKVTKRIGFYPNDYDAHYENVDGSSVTLGQDEIAKEKEQIDKEYAELVAMEAKLYKRREGLLSIGVTSAKMYERLANNTATHAELADWNNDQDSYQSDLDKLIVMQLDHFAKKINFYLKSVLTDLQHKITAAEYKELSDIYTATLRATESYGRMKERYGQPKDIPRTAKYRLLYDTAEQFVTRADAIMSGMEPSKPKPKQGKMYLALSKDLFKTLSSILFGNRQNTNYLAAANKLVRRFGDFVGVKVAVEGQEILDAIPKSKKVVNIIAPIHRHPIWDMVAYANLGIDNALPFMFFPKPVAKFITKYFNNVIAVGGGSDIPIEHSIAEIKKGYTQNLLIYPEGSVSAGMMETRPGREKMVSGLIKRLREEGFEVNLYPIVYKNTAKFGNENTISRAIEVATSIPQKDTFNVVEVL